MARAWYGDDGPHLARRPAVREDGALGKQARPVNLLGRARARCGCVLARGGVRRGETLLANGQSLHGSADSCGSDRRFLPGEIWGLLLAVAVPLPLRVFGRRGGEARGIAIDWVTGRSGPLTWWEERAQCTVRPPLAPRVSRRERCSAGTAPLKRGDRGDLVLPEPSGGPAFGVASAGRGLCGAAVPALVGGLDGAGSRGARQVPSGGFSPRVAVGLAPVHRCRLVWPGLFVLCGSGSFGAPLAVLGGAASAGAGVERGLALGAPLAAVGDGPDRWWPG